MFKAARYAAICAIAFGVLITPPMARADESPAGDKSATDTTNDPKMRASFHEGIGALLKMTGANFDTLFQSTLTKSFQEDRQKDIATIENNKKLTPAEKQGAKADLSAKYDKLERRTIELLKEKIDLGKEFETSMFDVFSRNFSPSEMTDILTFFKIAGSPGVLKFHNLSDGIMKEAVGEFEVRVAPALKDLSDEMKKEFP